jgi:transposase
VAFGLVGSVLEDVDLDDDNGAVIVSARPNARARNRCGHCGRRSPRFDRGDKRRRWRALDLGTTKVFIEAAVPRITCRVHGVTVASVPWARHGAGHTRDFDDQAAWLAVHVSKTAAAELLRIEWRTVGSIVTRVNADIDATVDRLDGLSRIGIDEIAYKRGHRYLTVVVDHDTGRLVWAAPGRDEATLDRFFDALGAQRAARLTHVTADMAPWIASAVRKRAPNAIRCADPFHIVMWATEALDVERRRAWNQASGRRSPNPTSVHRTGSTGDARTYKASRWALWKNPENLTQHQHEQLNRIAHTDDRLWSAYRLKEGLRLVFHLNGQPAKAALDEWTTCAANSHLPVFEQLQRRITKHRAAIDATLDHGLSNAIVESTNTKIRLLTRIAYGFHTPQALIALAMLALGGHPPHLPNRK